MLRRQLLDDPSRSRTRETTSSPQTIAFGENVLAAIDECDSQPPVTRRGFLPRAAFLAALLTAVPWHPAAEAQTASRPEFGDFTLPGSHEDREGRDQADHTAADQGRRDPVVNQGASTMSLLGYLIPRVASSGEEPAATQALAWLLNASPDLAQAFVGMVGRTGMTAFRPGRIAAEERHGNPRPDVTIRDDGNAVRILIENKFWAGLEDGQPVAYLDALPADASSGLVFIVPRRRMQGIWGELRERCRRAAVELTNEFASDTMTWARSGQRILAVTSWKHVLGTLEQAAIDGAHSALRQDIVQLRGLTDQMDASAFLPLREDEVADGNAALRLVNYSELIEDMVSRLQGEGVADTTRLGHSHGYTWAGRNLRLHAKFGAWLGVDLIAWRDQGITPIWLEHDTNDAFSGIEGKARLAEGLFDEAYVDDEDWLKIPIRLKTGVERDRVIDDAVRQMRDVADKLREEFPDR